MNGVQQHAFYDTDALTHALEEDGAVVLTGALPNALCERLREAIDALQPRSWDERHDDPLRGGGSLDRYLCVFNRDPLWLPMLDRPGVIELAEGVLGADCHVIGQTAWRSHPGYRSEPLHIDYRPPQGAHLGASAPLPPFILSAQFFLQEITVDLAPTRIVPGSHRTHSEPAEGDAVVVLPKAGDCLAFRSDVYHAGGENTTEERTRYLLQVHYGRREMAQHFPHALEWRFDPEVIRHATARQRRLLGEHDPGAYD